jgi:hypothetical protein
MMKDQLLKSSPPSGEAISHQLERMLGSPDLNATPQQSALLTYVVNQTLAGKADRIKGYTVATEVFGRRSDFDQSIDPIVSIQASRLRRAMERYYETAGKNDPLRIDIPKAAMYRHLMNNSRAMSPSPLNKPQRSVSCKPGRAYWFGRWQT